MMSCAEVRRHLDGFLELELEIALEDEVRRHLTTCGACRDILEERDPASALAVRLGARPAATDDGEDFVTGVLAGVRQRSLRRTLGRRRLRLAAAAALVLAAVLGVATVRPKPAQVAERPAALGPEPAFVEVEGEGVRVYELSGGASGVRVAFVVNPGMEL